MRKKLLWILFAVPLLAITLMPSAAKSSLYPCKVSVKPQVIWDEAMGPGTQFSVDICVDDVEDLWGYQFWLFFNAEVLELSSIEDGPFLGSEGWPVDVANWDGVDYYYVDETDPLYEIVGSTYIGESKLWGAVLGFFVWPPTPDYLPDGSGVLATVTFDVVGYGGSRIILGPETGLVGTTQPPPLPAEPYWIFYGGDPVNGWTDIAEPGFFANVPGPELEMPHGVSGVWEEYQTILVGEVQTQYCRIRNWGELGAYVTVDFIVRGPEGIEIKGTLEEWVPPRAPDGTPGDVTVSANYVPGPPGQYYVSALVYFKAGCMTEMAPYYLVEGTLGGEASSRDINVAYKVKTHM